MLSSVILLVLMYSCMSHSISFRIHSLIKKGLFSFFVCNEIADL